MPEPPDRVPSYNRGEKGAGIQKRTILVTGLGLAALSAAAGYGLLRRFEVVEQSMRPALEPGDWVVSRRRSGTPPRGRIVVFGHPARPGKLLIKRVIGLPGERMDITSGRVAVDGRILAEPWAQGPTLPNGTWHVPTDSIFALGDRRTVSAGDGRSTGPIPLVDVGWVMIARYRPLTRAGFV